MMATHEVLVPVITPRGAHARVGDRLNYDGPPNWKFRPLDPADRETWESETADPARVAGCLDAVPAQTRHAQEYDRQTFDYLIAGGK